MERMVKIAGFIVICILSSSCARSLIVNTEYNFPDPEGWGTIFFSVTNPTNNGNSAYIYIAHEDKAINDNGLADIHPLKLSKGLLIQTNKIFFTIDGDDPDASILGDEDYIAALRLPAGKYHIYNWSLRDGNSSWSPRKIQLFFSFEVTKDQANYIGNFTFILDEQSKRFSFDVKDDYAEDTKKITKRVKAIPESKIKKNIANTL